VMLMDLGVARSTDFGRSPAGREGSCSRSGVPPP
jgi:hypothetical protein